MESSAHTINGETEMETSHNVREREGERRERGRERERETSESEVLLYYREVCHWSKKVMWRP